MQALIISPIIFLLYPPYFTSILLHTTTSSLLISSLLNIFTCPSLPARKLKFLGWHKKLFTSRLISYCTPPFESKNLVSIELPKVLHVPLFHILYMFFLRGSPFPRYSMDEILLLFLIQLINFLIYSVYSLLPPKLRYNEFLLSDNYTQNIPCYCNDHFIC